LFKSVCSASKNYVVTADPLTLSLRFAAMGELYRCHIKSSN